MPYEIKATGYLQLIEAFFFFFLSIVCPPYVSKKKPQGSSSSNCFSIFYADLMRPFKGGLEQAALSSEGWFSPSL
jgi:hypothetical protein